MPNFIEINNRLVNLDTVRMIVPGGPDAVYIYFIADDVARTFHDVSFTEIKQLIEQNQQEKPEIKTNYDRVRNMSVAEMAEILMCPTDGLVCSYATGEENKENCTKCVANWLNSEVDS